MRSRQELKRCVNGNVISLEVHNKKRGKGVLLQKIDLSTDYWLKDWGMKFIPLFYRESMQEWFGNRGISNHTDCLFFQDPDDINKLKKVTYYTIIERSNQNGTAVLCVNTTMFITNKERFSTL